jgi:hypothetical protein
MGRYVRYIVHQRVGKERRQVGLFTAAYSLRDDGDLDRADYQKLLELLTWFQTELPVPPGHLIPNGAVFWYKQAGRFSQRMWELAQLLGDYGYTAELVTAAFVGRIVYQDEHQVAAIRPSRRHR